MNKKLKSVNLSCVRQQKLLFKNISFELGNENLLLIEGENGTGKSSLLRMLAGLALPFSGSIYWQDISIHQSPLFKEDLHFVSHSNGIKHSLTLKENLELTAGLAQSDFSFFDDVIADLALKNCLDTPASQLSAGQKRKLALAKLFMIHKPLWILDEPLNALDGNAQLYFLSKLKEHLNTGGIAVISTHHPLAFKTFSANSLRLEIC